MIFNDDFFEELPEDLNESIEKMCKAFYQFLENLGNNESYADYYDDFIDAFAGIEAFIEVNKLDFSTTDLTSDNSTNISRVIEFFNYVNKENNQILSDNKLQAARFKYKSKLNSVFSYKFSDGDLTRIQELINDLRQMIASSELFEDDHKSRLLKRLEKLQSELHKRVSNLDRFWGLVGDAGIVIGKFGTDAKPFVDRIKEIADIVWRTQASAEELPSGTTMPILNQDN